MRQRLELLYTRYKKQLLTIAFLTGFTIDLLTLNSVEQVFDNIVLLWNLFLSMAAIVVMYLGIADKLGSERMSALAARYAPLVMQFALGGLFSGILIFYTRSGSLFTSWPFLLMIIAVIAGNEFIARRTQRLIFNLVVLFVALFSYLALILPVLIGKMGAWVFVGSGVLAVLVMVALIKLLARIVPRFMALNARLVVVSLGLVYVAINALYFTNVIPPIPLSLKDVGIYREVEKLDDGGYELTYEKAPWYFFWRTSEHVYRYMPSDQIFCFASVFTPTRLSTDIFHHWEYFDEEANRWMTHARLSYHIEGGRDTGFRGYTVISASREGAWRCTVETGRGQVVGREKFRIENGAPERDIVTRVNY